MHFDLSALLGPALLSQAFAFLQVVFIDIVMAGDNAVAVGIAAAGLKPDKRRQAILYGMIAAVVLRIGFVLITVQLLKVTGLLVAGGLLLLWVCWKMYRELREHHEAEKDENRTPKAKSLFSAVIQILAADVSMSLDNVLAVAGAAQNHVWVLVFGLVFSIAAMGLAANMIAGILHRWRWIGYVGVLVVLFVALHMIYDGSIEVWERGHCDITLKCVPVMAENTKDWWIQAYRDLSHLIDRLFPHHA